MPRCATQLPISEQRQSFPYDRECYLLMCQAKVLYWLLLFSCYVLSNLETPWTEENVFLELPYFLHDPVNVGNLISGSSAFSRPSLYIWKFSVHTLLKPTLKDSEHNLNYCVKWMLLYSSSLKLPFFGIRMKAVLFQSCGHYWVFQICWHTEWSTLIASSFRIWNSSAGILLPPLALFTVMLPKAHLT